MGVFHWGCLVGYYGIFEGREQCLQSWIGSVVVSNSNSTFIALNLCQKTHHTKNIVRYS